MTDKQLLRLWGTSDRVLRIFVSHKAARKKEALKIKAGLGYLGISCFVSYEDIESLRKWQAEIVRALRSMDALVAMLTPDFHDSDWTDQEIGAAVGRNVPVIPIDLGGTPYGFFGKIQAIRGTNRSAADIADEVFEQLMSSNHGKLKRILTDSFIQSLRERDSFEDCERWAKVFSELWSKVGDGMIRRRRGFRFRRPGCRR